MGRIIFQYHRLKIRVRDVVLFMVLILLLFFCMKGCQNTEIKKKKEDKVNQPCVLMEENVHELNELLKRNDLCSDDWYRDLDDYRERLEEQNILLRKQTDKEDQTLLQLQENIGTALDALRKTPQGETIDELEKAVQEYQSNYRQRCAATKDVQ